MTKMRPMHALWTDLTARANVSLSQDQADQLNRYLDLLLAANQTMNLTRIADRPTAETQHIGDALTLLPFLPATPHTLADVGTGGGVPGIPLAIVRPDTRVTLIEVTKKKAAFLSNTIAELGLENVNVIAERVEDVGQGDLRETFDVAVARAVATMTWLAEWCLPLVHRDGKALFMKGPKVAEELPEASLVIKMCNGRPPVIHPVELPGTEHRVIVEIAKSGKADWRLPRLPTSAKGRPFL
jgi:16S rRNA (guanine527-N7)-methyltransferase